MLVWRPAPPTESDQNLIRFCYTNPSPKSGGIQNDRENMVRIAGLEPARVTPLPPQSSVSANSTICAHEAVINEAGTVALCKGICARGENLRANSHSKFQSTESSERP